MNARFRTYLFACALSPLLLAGRCEDADEPPPDCDQRVGAEAAGAWTLHADGERWDCSDETLNGDLQLDVRRFTVTARPVASNDDSSADTRHEADAFVERIRRAQYTLEAGTNAPRGLDFQGEVNTCQVSFVMHEALPDGSSHSYEFDGFVESRFRIYGEFTGRGPANCRSSGEFEVELR